jgi:hypothetical protein
MEDRVGIQTSTVLPPGWDEVSMVRGESEMTKVVEDDGTEREGTVGEE